MYFAKEEVVAPGSPRRMVIADAFFCDACGTPARTHVHNYKVNPDAERNPLVPVSVEQPPIKQVVLCDVDFFKNPTLVCRRKRESV